MLVYLTTQNGLLPNCANSLVLSTLRWALQDQHLPRVMAYNTWGNVIVIADNQPLNVGRSNNSEWLAPELREVSPSLYIAIGTLKSEYR